MKVRWFWLRCAKSQCIARAGWGAGTARYVCPHRVRVMWRPDLSSMVYVSDDVRSPGGGLELFIPVGEDEDGVELLRLAATGTAVMPWWVAWRLGRQMRHTFRQQAAMATVRSGQAPSGQAPGAGVGEAP